MLMSRQGEYSWIGIGFTKDILYFHNYPRAKDRRVCVHHPILEFIELPQIFFLPLLLPLCLSLFNFLADHSQYAL